MAEGTRVVEVVPYTPNWKTEFGKIRDRINQYIGDLILRIEHVGSTSVEGLSAKPIIDLDVVIDSYHILPEVIKRLESFGYEYQGNLGIQGREAFRKDPEAEFMNYHLYVCPKDGKGYLEHIAFRDYLRCHEDARNEYQQLKLRLSQEFHFDIDSYCESKTDFVRSILDKALYCEQGK